MSGKRLTEKQIQKKIREVLKTGMWMLRRSDAGKSYGGFQWETVGCWTEAPDWNQKSQCGGGLHGNGPKSSGYWTGGKDLDFCAVEDVVDIDGDKIKCRRAMILLRNSLPDNLSCGGSLDLSGCTGITSLPDNLSVGESLYLSGCTIKNIEQIKRKFHCIF